MLTKMKNIKGEEYSLITCEDIIFSLLDESLRKIEPLVIRFYRESVALKNLALSLSYKENYDYIRRTHLAKEEMEKFTLHLKQLSVFYDDMLDQEV